MLHRTATTSYPCFGQDLGEFRGSWSCRTYPKSAAKVQQKMHMNKKNVKKMYFCCIFSCAFKKIFIPLRGKVQKAMNDHLSKAQIKWVRSLQQKKHRDAEGLFVAEGEKCVNDLRQAFELVLLATPDNASSVEIEQMSSLRTPQGTIAVFRKRPIVSSPDRLIASSPECLSLALDGVQDPGNLGTIIRTCDWFGIHHILCSRDTADCYNPKVVQATMGALARVRLHYVDLPNVLAGLCQQGIPLYGTLLDGQNMYDNNAIPDKQRGIIIMGNEGNGISPEVRQLITHPLFIPSYPADIPTSESLNVGVATAIVLSEFRRKQ